MAEGNSEDLNQPMSSNSKSSKTTKCPYKEEKYPIVDPCLEIKFEGRKLTTLKELPYLLELLELSLADNFLDSGLDELEERMPKLRLLNLTGNNFKSVESLTPLKNMQFLEHLSVYDCPLTDNDTYRSEIFALLTNLKSLDGFGKDGKGVKVVIDTTTANTEAEGGCSSKSAATSTANSEKCNESEKYNKSSDEENPDNDETETYRKFKTEDCSDQNSIDDGEYDPDNEDPSDNNNESTTPSEGEDTEYSSSRDVTDESGSEDNDPDVHPPSAKRPHLDPSAEDSN